MIKNSRSDTCMLGTHTCVPKRIKIVSAQFCQTAICKLSFGEFVFLMSLESCHESFDNPAGYPEPSRRVRNSNIEGSKDLFRISKVYVSIVK
jgi:hypothetical protein